MSNGIGDPRIIEVAERQVRLKSLPMQWLLVAIAERSAWAILRPWRVETGGVATSLGDLRTPGAPVKVRVDPSITIAGRKPLQHPPQLVALGRLDSDPLAVANENAVPGGYPTDDGGRDALLG